MLKLGIIGVGYWGEKLMRTFAETDGCTIAWTADPDPEKRAELLDFRKGLAEVDAVAVATPSPTHYAIALECLYVGKHVFLEKPMAMSSRHAETLVREARKRNLRLMIDHLLLFHPAVIRMRSMVSLGEIGDVVSVIGSRIGAKVRKDENVMWSLAPHDLSIALPILGEPISVSASGMIENGKDSSVEDIVYLFVRFSGRKYATFCFDWLRKRRTRNFTIIGTEGSIMFDDLNAKKLVIRKNRTDTVVNTENWMPLDVACLHFTDRVRDGVNPLSDGESALSVIKTLEMAQGRLDEARG